MKRRCHSEVSDFRTMSRCRDGCDSPWQVCEKPVCVAL